MIRPLLPLVVGAVTLGLTGCNNEPKTYRVTGTVSWQKELIKDGRINLVAEDGQTQPGTAPIIDGKFELRVTAGAKRVEVYGQRSKGYDKVMKQETFESFVPPDFNARSKLTFEVQANDDNVLELALPK